MAVVPPIDSQYRPRSPRRVPDKVDNRVGYIPRIPTVRPRCDPPGQQLGREALSAHDRRDVCTCQSRVESVVQG